MLTLLYETVHRQDVNIICLHLPLIFETPEMLPVEVNCWSKLVAYKHSSLETEFGRICCKLTLKCLM